jgi:hypothetical protein
MGENVVQRFLWMAVLAGVMVGSVLNPASCHAQARCLWLNAATAEGVLGGTVQMDVTPLTLQGDATCEFTRKMDSTVYLLRIAVHSMDNPSNDFASYLSQCDGTTIPLKAIGNEAVQCVPRGSSTTGEERVIGRVRERAFILTIRRNMPAVPKEGLREDTRNTAEQIAGSLF